MVLSRLGPVVALVGAYALASVLASSSPSPASEEKASCFDCWKKFTPSPNVTYKLALNYTVSETLACFYEQQNVAADETFCSYNISSGIVETDLDEHCPQMARWICDFPPKTYSVTA